MAVIQGGKYRKNAKDSKGRWQPASDEDGNPLFGPVVAFMDGTSTGEIKSERTLAHLWRLTDDRHLPAFRAAVKAALLEGAGYDPADAD